MNLSDKQECKNKCYITTIILINEQVNNNNKVLDPKNRSNVVFDKIHLYVSRRLEMDDFKT